MVERKVDKEIRVLREILKPQKDTAFVDTYSLKISVNDLDSILKELSGYGIINIALFGDIPVYQDGEPTDTPSGDVVAHLDTLDRKKLEELLNKLQDDFPKRDKPLIKEKALELISQKMGNFDNGVNLHEFLIRSGVDAELAIYPNTKWRMICDALQYLSFSERPVDQKALFDVIGESTHPLMHNGNRELAEGIQKDFSELLSYDGFAIKNYKVVKADEEPKPEVKENTPKIVSETKPEQIPRKAKALRDFGFMKDYSVKNLSLFRDVANALKDVIDLELSYTEETNLRVKPEAIMGKTMNQGELSSILNKLCQDKSFEIIGSLEWDDLGGFYSLSLSKINLENLQTIRVFLNDLIPERNKDESKEPLQIAIKEMPELKINQSGKEENAKIRILKGRINFGSNVYVPSDARTAKAIDVLYNRVKGRKVEDKFRFSCPLKAIAFDLGLEEKKTSETLYGIGKEFAKNHIPLEVSIKQGVFSLTQA